MWDFLAIVKLKKQRLDGGVMLSYIHIHKLDTFGVLVQRF